MHFLRYANTLTRLTGWVLVWFALSISAAVASPPVKPQAIELICQDSGAMTLRVKSDDGNTQSASHTLDCPRIFTTSLYFKPSYPPRRGCCTGW